MQTMAAATDTFFTLLAAPGRSAEIPESADVYGWLVGSWELHGQTWKLEGEFRAKRMQP
jgi:hypothetical protein